MKLKFSADNAGRKRSLSFKARNDCSLLDDRNFSPYQSDFSGMPLQIIAKLIYCILIPLLHI